MVSLARIALIGSVALAAGPCAPATTTTTL
jgi:hypothetical protein